MNKPNIYVYPIKDQKQFKLHSLFRKGAALVILSGLFAITLNIMTMFPDTDILWILRIIAWYLVIFNTILFFLLVTLFWHSDVKDTILIKDGRNILLLDDVTFDMDPVTSDLYINDIVIPLKNTHLILDGLDTYIQTKSINPELYSIQPSLYELIDDAWTEYRFFTDCSLIKEKKRTFVYEGTQITPEKCVSDKRFCIHKIFKRLSVKNLEKQIPHKQ